MQLYTTRSANWVSCVSKLISERDTLKAQLEEAKEALEGAHYCLSRTHGLYFEDRSQSHDDTMRLDFSQDIAVIDAALAKLGGTK